MKKITAFVLGILVAFGVVGDVVAGGGLYIYNWSDYIANGVIEAFEKEYNIKVTYDTFDSNETLEAKLLSGKTGYDIVAPSSDFLPRQIAAGAFIALDKKKLPNWKNLDKTLLAEMAVHDPDNKYAFPYMWGTTGIGYNKEKLQKIIGAKTPINSWNLLFDPKYAKEISKCGIAVLDAPTEIIPIALSYLGIDPSTQDLKDYQRAESLIQKIRPYITYFHSSRYITDLANGNICMVVGWSGDVLQASNRATEAKKNYTIEYIIPKEGAPLWFDTMTIPQGAKNIDNAHIFLNYMMRPKVIAKISNYISYANVNTAATTYINDKLKNNNNIYPNETKKGSLYIFKTVGPKLNRIITRSWNRIKSGH